VENEPLIECKSVWKIFGDRSDAAIRAVKERGIGKAEVMQEFNCVVGVADVSLGLGKGEILCVMGLSGSGKSTLIRLFNRLIEPSLGQMLLHGEDIGSMSLERLREVRAKKVGMVFQSVTLLPHRTVLENAAFGLEVQKIDKARRHEIAGAALAKVGLGDWLNRYPHELSGGMQQRVGLARALASDPEIILMDEPFSALDPLIRRQLQNEFRQLSKELGKSALFITHDLDEAIRLGDRIAVMKDGAVVQLGTAEDIVLRPKDAYVEDFVAGVSRLHLVKAHSVMHHVGDFQSRQRGVNPATLPAVLAEAELDTLIQLMTKGRQDSVAVTDAGKIVGVVTLRSLLQGVRGREPTEEIAL
jgi:glycine betaine/proline transport system ATP-binding protein